MVVQQDIGRMASDGNVMYICYTCDVSEEMCVFYCPCI